MIVAVVGGIAAGKSTVVDLLLELARTRDLPPGQAAPRAESINADAIAHEVLNSPSVRSQVVEWLGPGALEADGSVDRRQVAERVFSDRGALAHLESLVHPEVRRRIAARIESFRQAASSSDLLVLDIPLLARTPFPRDCDSIVFVETSSAERVRRAKESRGWDEAELKRRETMQAPIAETRRLADFVIDNSGDRETTREQAKRYMAHLASAAAPGPKSRLKESEAPSTGC